VSYAIHAAALRLAHQKNYDDALMLNENNQVAEVTSANIFWVKRGKIFTTPLSSGCLDGITRRKAIAEVRRLKLQVSENHTTLTQLENADELFVTSSLKLVLPVQVIRNGRRTLKFEPGMIAARLAQRFRRLAGLPDATPYGF
jgi:branched-chain amino acid aminotransferase